MRNGSSEDFSQTSAPVRPLNDFDAPEWAGRAILFSAFGVSLLLLSRVPSGISVPSQLVAERSSFAVREEGQWRWREATGLVGTSPFWLRAMRRSDTEFVAGNAALNMAPGSVAFVDSETVETEANADAAPDAKKGSERILTLDRLQGALRVRPADPGENPLRMRLGPALVRLAPSGSLAVARRANSQEWELAAVRGGLDVTVLGRTKKWSEGSVLRLAYANGKDGALVAREVFRLAFTPRYPKTAAQVVFSPPTERIDFSWEGDAAPHLELDSDPGFPNPRVLATAGFSARADVGAGKYYWRLRTANGLSLAASFSVVPRVRYELETPKRATRVNVPIALSWSPISWAQGGVAVEVAKDGRFEKPIFEKTVLENTVEFVPRQAGQYYWRIRALHPEWGDWEPATAESFKVLGAPKPKPAPVAAAVSSEVPAGDAPPAAVEAAPAAAPEAAPEAAP